MNVLGVDVDVGAAASVSAVAPRLQMLPIVVVGTAYLIVVAFD